MDGNKEEKLMAKVIPIPIGPIFTGGPCRGLVHVIQKGDTLYELGKQYHVSVTQLMFANPFVDVYNLQIGDELCIPATIQPRQAEDLSQGRQVQMPAGRGEGSQLPEAVEGALPFERTGVEMAPAIREEGALPDRMEEERLPEPMPSGLLGGMRQD